MAATAIIVSGLPAGGKSTTGQLLAERLGFRFLDKDDFLEVLFDKEGVDDAEKRRELSNEANIHFEAAAKNSDNVVLVSHWRPRGEAGPSGTSTKWLIENYETIVEVCCTCPIDIAAKRFVERERHPGHFDKVRSYDEVRTWIAQYAKGLPLGHGHIVEVNTSVDVDVSSIVAKIESYLPA